MALITPPKTPTLSKEQEQHRLKATLGGKVNILFRQMLAVYTDGMASIWQNAALTPQEAFDAFGTDAGELVRLAGVLKDAMNSAKPGSISHAPAAFTVNEDGTVMVG
jgi:hypothetical protein